MRDRLQSFAYRSTANGPIRKSALSYAADFLELCEPVLTALDHKVDKVVIDSMAF